MSVIIKIDSVSKIYKLYNKPVDRLKESLNPLKKKYHKDFYALENISLNIKKGEVVGIVGKNGSGKSTLLKLITGVLSYSSGNIDVKGKVTALLELGAGFNPELTGLENLYLSGAISGFSKNEIDTKIDSIVEFADIEDFINQPLKTYSSGMKARLGFALAINVEPEILIIDEALSVGDAAFARKCYTKIENMCESNDVTVLFVSHSSGVIKQLCTRAVMLHNGIKVIDGNAKDVVNLYDKFMGSNNIDVNEIKQELDEKQKSNKIKNQEYINSTANFSKNIVSKSIVKYKENGALISDIKIINKDNEVCNILNFNEEYTYQYKVNFFNDFENIKVAMYFKTKEGLGVSGKGSKINEYGIKSVKAGSQYLVSWKFKNIFNEGYYFLNAGVNSSMYGEKTILHRIIDGYMFKSSKEIKSDSHGIVDFGIRLNIEEIKN